MASDADNPLSVVLWRLQALEEAMKFQAGQIEGLRDRVNQAPDQMAREFPTRLEVQKDYLSRAELSNTAQQGRDVWTLRILVLGTFVSNCLSAMALIHH